MSANLVGFVLGTDGTRYFVEQIVGRWQGERSSRRGWRGDRIIGDVLQAGVLSYSLCHVYILQSKLCLNTGQCFRHLLTCLPLNLIHSRSEEEKRRGIFRKC